MENTAVSAKKVLEDADVTQAAVASEIAGKLYGLKVLQPSINYNKNNVTRFIILAKAPVYCKGANKISICFECAHKQISLQHSRKLHLQQCQHDDDRVQTDTWKKLGIPFLCRCGRYLK